MKNTGQTGHRSFRIRIVFILLLIGFPFFFFGGPGYHAARSFKAAWDLGHILFFFLASYLMITCTRSGRREKKSWLFFGLSLLVVLVAGVIIELVQQAIGGRSVDGWDVYRNLLGCLTAFTVTGALPLASRGYLFLSAAVLVLLLAAVWPLYPSLADERTARRQFPLLSDFETPFEQNRWKDVRQLQRQKNIVRRGQYALRVQLTTATYSGTSLFYFPHDWRDFRTLHFSVYNPDEEVLFLHCRIHDRLHTQHGMRFDDRFHKRFTLRPGWNDLSVSLQEVRTAPVSRLMDMAQVQGFGLFVIRQPRARVLYLDSIYLSR